MNRITLLGMMCALCTTTPRSSATELVFTIDQTQSEINLYGTLITDLGTDSDSDSSALAGSFIADLASTESPFGQIHITDLDMTTADTLSLSFCVVEIFGCMAGLDVSAGAGDITVFTVVPGPAVPVTAGAFDQVDNIMQMSGIIDVDATGLLDGVIPEGPTPFLSDETVASLAGTVSRLDATITLNLPFEVQVSSEDPDTGVIMEFDIDALIVAHAEAPVDVIGDMNCDALVDFTDVADFVDALIFPDDFDACDLDHGDMNQDGAVDGDDIAEFVQAVLTA